MNTLHLNPPRFLCRRTWLALCALVLSAAAFGATNAEPAHGATTRVELTSADAGAFFAAARLGTQTTRDGKRVVGIVDLTATGGGLFCGTCDDEYGFYTLRMGGRLHARLLRLPAACSAQPGSAGVSVIGSRARPFVDVPAGKYRVVGQVPARRLTAGKWRLCAWFEFNPAFEVSNPVFPGSLPGFSVPHEFAGPFPSPKSVRLP
jgi:hypothetical protein